MVETFERQHYLFQTISRYWDLFHIEGYIVRTKEAKKVLEKGSQSKVSLHTLTR